MSKKLAILIFLLIPCTGCILFSQTRSAFTGDITKFKVELTDMMGSNLDVDQTNILRTFLTRWDSAAFSKENMVRIINISSQLSSRLMRPVPHFNNYLITLNSFIENKISPAYFTNWLMGLSEIAFSPRYTNDVIDKFIKNTTAMIKGNVLYESGSVRWKVKNCDLKFLHDTAFYVEITNATITCYTQKDSTELYNVTGSYFPDIQQLRGTKGIVTWEKAGFSRKDVYAELNNFTINTTKNNFTIDSASIWHSTYFKAPVSGVLSDQAATFANVEKATFPRFETYTKEFQIKNLYEGVAYEGGLFFEGANVKGTGKRNIPAKIFLFRNDTLYLKISSNEFLFSKAGLNSHETSMSLYLDKDSIYHVNLGFSYFAATRQVNLYRTNVPISKSPYTDSFHSFDMYFEYLT